MATILDVGILEYFMPVFVWLFVWALLYAILDKTNLFGDNKFLKALVSFSLSMLFLLTQNLMKLVSIITPWFVILIIAVLFIMLFFMFVGAKNEQIAAAFTDKVVIWTVLIVLGIIFIYGITQVYGTDIHTVYGGGNATETEGLNQAIGKILFHPKILGVALIMLIAAQAIRLVAQGVVTKK